jgi:ADP-ribose pyrophosphatase YjhB (NUDIX family)
MRRKQDSIETIASGNMPRISVRAVVLSKGRTLVQKDSDDPNSCYAFIGGQYEVGDTFVSRLKREFEEETTAEIVDCKYLFVVENRLRVNGKLTQSVDYYLEVTVDREDIESKEKHLSQHWLPISTLKDYDLRPWIVRDVIAEHQVHSVRHLVVPLDGG